MFARPLLHIEQRGRGFHSLHRLCKRTLSFAACWLSS